MKYVITWHERPAASFRDYEAAQERILGIFKDWQMPASFTNSTVRSPCWRIRRLHDRRDRQTSRHLEATGIPAPDTINGIKQHLCVPKS